MPRVKNKHLLLLSSIGHLGSFGISSGPTFASAASFTDLGWIFPSVLVGQMAVGWPRMLSQLRQLAILLPSLLLQQDSLGVVTEWVEACEAFWDLSSGLEFCLICLIVLAVVNYRPPQIEDLGRIGSRS